MLSKAIPSYEAPRAYASGFFSASQLMLCYLKHSSSDLHPRFSALADKDLLLHKTIESLLENVQGDIESTPLWKISTTKYIKLYEKPC